MLKKSLLFLTFIPFCMLLSCKKNNKKSECVLQSPANNAVYHAGDTIVLLGNYTTGDGLASSMNFDYADVSIFNVSDTTQALLKEGVGENFSVKYVPQFTTETHLFVRLLKHIEDDKTPDVCNELYLTVLP